MLLLLECRNQLKYFQEGRYANKAIKGFRVIGILNAPLVLFAMSSDLSRAWRPPLTLFEALCRIVVTRYIGAKAQ